MLITVLKRDICKSEFVKSEFVKNEFVKSGFVKNGFVKSEFVEKRNETAYCFWEGNTVRILDQYKESSSKEISPKEMREIFIQKFKEETGNKKVLYIHTPYCNGKCRFCICPSISYRSLEDVKSFAKNILPGQIDLYRDIFDAVSFDEIYFGGGTPTLYSAKELEEIFALIPGFDSIPVKSMEGSPNTLALEHLDLFKENHFSFLSLGVQSLDRNLLSYHRRVYIPPEQLTFLSDTIRERKIYFNMDLICYLGPGDITEIPDFKKDLEFVMRDCRPSSITIHQHLQARFTREKTELLIRLIREMLEKYPEYECVNSLLTDEEIERDTIYRAEFRLVREKREFRHYLCTKYPSVPVPGSDVLAIGWLDRENMPSPGNQGIVSIKSNAGNLLYEPAKKSRHPVDFPKELVEEERRIREAKGLPL